MTVVAIFFAVVAAVCGLGWYGEQEIRRQREACLTDTRQALRAARDERDAWQLKYRSAQMDVSYAEGKLHDIRDLLAPAPDPEKP